MRWKRAPTLLGYAARSPPFGSTKENNQAYLCRSWLWGVWVLLTMPVFALQKLSGDIKTVTTPVEVCVA